MDIYLGGLNMTMPDERTRAIRYAHNFLRDLLYKDVTPRVPKEIRERARSILKHYPWPMYVDMLVEKAPEILGKDETYRKKR